MFDLLERVHSEGNVHAWAVRQEGSKSGLLKQPKDEDFVTVGTKSQNKQKIWHSSKGTAITFRHSCQSFRLQNLTLRRDGK